ncbi:hypothetical protein O3M35_006575 [Rhynocoris fuscipes]|uniref:Uncharacterized protein n=1 Tax=Rhynocoris fuscipes TaxID=488301 RepID=A0AAW1DL91_9HEMI
MVDLKYATLSCSVRNTVGLINLNILYNLRIAKLYRMQKDASEYLQIVLEI